MTWRPILSTLALALLYSTPGRADIILAPYVGQSWSGIINDAEAGYPIT